MPKRIFVLHGWEGTPSSNWFPWLKLKLEERGIKVEVPQLPNAESPKQRDWLLALDKLVGVADEETYFIGHSLGCITIMRYLEGLKEGEEIGGAVFVAGFTDDLGIEEISDFFTTSIDWNKINLHCKTFVAIASDNDQYVSLKYSDILKEKLNAKVFIQPKMGHFNIPELHVALNELLKMINA